MTTNQFSAVIGFAFVAAAIALGFGWAVLCLAGAAVFAALASYARGEAPLAELQQRLADASSERRQSQVTPAPAVRRRTPRVQ